MPGDLRGMDLVDAPSTSQAATATPVPAEVLLRVEKLLQGVKADLDAMGGNTDSYGVYAIDEGNLLKLPRVGTMDDSKKSHLLSGKPCFIIFEKWVKDHGAEPNAVFGYDWKSMDDRPSPHIAFAKFPVPGHPDMLLAAPAEELKPGLYSLHNYDKESREYGFGVGTPDEEAFWRQVAQDNPKSWHSHSYLGAMLWRKNDIDGALEQWKKSVELRPEIYETHNNYALALNAKGRVDEALEQYKEAVAAHGPWVVRLNYARALLAAGHYDAAIGQYDAYLKFAPGDPDALSAQADCYSAKGEWDVAAKCLEMVLKIRPDDATVKQKLETAQQKEKEAQDAFDKIWGDK